MGINDPAVLCGLQCLRRSSVEHTCACARARALKHWLRGRLVDGNHRSCSFDFGGWSFGDGREVGMGGRWIVDFGGWVLVGGWFVENKT